MNRMRSLEPKGCLVATVDKKAIGFATAISYAKKLGWIGNVVVERNRRGRGIGSALVNECISHLLRSRVRQIGLNCFPENQSLYRRLGFEKIDGFARLSIKRRTREKTRRTESIPFSRILKIDRWAFGADRARLLRRLLREFPEGWSWSIERADVSGYSVVKEYQDSSEIGPSVCRQSDREAIETLLRSSVALARKWPLEISIPESNQAVSRITSRLGFRVERKGFVMHFADLEEIAINSSIVALGFLDKG